MERRLLDEEYEEGRFEPERDGGGNAAAAAANGEDLIAAVGVVVDDADDVVAAVRFDVDGIIPLI